jgi:quercetin dioxygenase-like cupin family protein
MTTSTITDAPARDAARPDHSYLKTRRISGDVLRFQLAFEEARLHEAAAASPAQRAGKTLVKEVLLRINQLALQKGTGLPGRDIGGALSIQVLRGRLQMTTADEQMELAPGTLVVLDGRVRHSAVAMSDCVVLITIALQEAVVA